VANKPDIFNIDQMAFPSPVNDLELDLDLKIQLGMSVKAALQDNKAMKLDLDVVEGKPLEELLEKAEAIKTDLVVIGQNTDKRHHGILAKNLARQVWSNSLIIPGKSKPGLSRILVPVDFSIPSAEAMRMAVGMRKRQPGLQITLVHIYEMPPGLNNFSFDEIKVKQVLEDDRRNTFRQFVGNHLPHNDQEGLETVILNAGQQSMGQQLVEYAEKNKYDLIIMGSKGHSKLALLLMGSMTEKVVSQTESVPVLIVK
jgi:nucleotide-binding universal stress UspA family protein